MRFRQYYINEVFDSKLESFDIQTQNASTFQTHFRTETLEFYFVADLIESEYGDNWEVEFYRYEAHRPIGKRGQWGTLKDVSQKEAFQVFSGVRKSLETFIKKYKPERFVFNAEDPAHQKAYDTLSKVISKKAKYKLVRTPAGKMTIYNFMK